MLRTQIYLPEELRKEVDKHRAYTRESLSDYVRKAVKERTDKNKRRQLKIKKVLKSLATLDPNKSGWKDVDPVQWQREIRQDRI